MARGKLSLTKSYSLDRFEQVERSKTQKVNKQEFIAKIRDSYGLNCKEVCNGGVACSLFKLGSLEKTIIASLNPSGLHPGNIFFVGKRCPMSLLGNDGLCRFLTKKKDQKILCCQIDF